ncbi:MAG: hypothetical protein LBF62_09645 [Tannerellaceae bacterium]|jgi:hypothetical protein|nr:hypothetical protein [Tannerellaceae bacterium]
MWQIILVAMAGIAAAVYTGYRIYRLTVHIRRGGGGSPCGGRCNCELKNRINSQKDCPEVK